MDRKNARPIVLAVLVWLVTALADRYLNVAADWIEAQAAGAGLLARLGAEGVPLLASGIRTAWAMIPTVIVFVVLRRHLTATADSAAARDTEGRASALQSEMRLADQLDRTRRDLDNVAAELRREGTSRDSTLRAQLSEALGKLTLRVERLEARANRPVCFESACDLIHEYKQNGGAGDWVRVRDEETATVKFLEEIGAAQTNERREGLVWRPKLAK